MALLHILKIIVSVAIHACISHAAQYEEYILAPSSRTLHPVSIFQINGSVTGAESLASDAVGSANITDNSSVTFDFGKEIGGVVSFSVGQVDPSDQYIGITFAESSLWVSSEGSDGSATTRYDTVYWFLISGPGDYTMPPEWERGGFRYLTLTKNTTGTLEVTRVTTNFTPMPHYAEDALKNYTGFFNSDDELINRIWYAGAYTNQLCTIAPAHGNSLMFLVEDYTGDSNPFWYLNTTISNGSSVLIDGARRDRLVWAGDMSIAVPGIAVSTNDLITVWNSLASLFALQNTTTGQIPYAGTGFPIQYSDTYHLYSLIGVSNYYLYSADLDSVSSIWEQWKFAMSYSISLIDSSGLMNVTLSADWLRFGLGAHNIEANSILYHTLNQGIILASAFEDDAIVTQYTNIAATLKAAANTLLWDDAAGFYNDNQTSTLHPQDGNSWAVVSNLTDSVAKIKRISANLQARWGPYGAPAPEAGTAISPFISGFELQTHFLDRNATRALELIRLEWGFMLNDPRMTGSSFIEGYDVSGELHYAPYPNDVRISHAHGWATGPTSSLISYVAGLQLEGPAGQTWRLKPMLGDLSRVHAGFLTELGTFENQIVLGDDGGFTVAFETPVGTKGTLELEHPALAGTIVVHSVDGSAEDVTVVVDENGSDPIVVPDLSGGQWLVSFDVTGSGT